MIYLNSGSVFNYDAYWRYLDGISESMPDGIRSVVQSGWYRDYTHDLFPHDAWLQSLLIMELNQSVSDELRSCSIRTGFLGSKHNLRFDFEYENVVKYELNADTQHGSSLYGSKNPNWTPRMWHGDWLFDEMTMDASNNVMHEVLFSSGATIRIWCRDVKHSWLPV